MGRHDCESQGHHHHEGTSHYCHPHDDGLHVKASPIPAKEKLIIRLEHTLRHNSDHAGFYGQLADAAVEAGSEEAARQIRAALACITEQNDHLEKALGFLKS